MAPSSRNSFYPLSIVLLLAIVGTSTAKESVISGNQQKSFLKPTKPFSAVLVEYNRQNDQVKRRTKLSLSKYGMRTEGLNLESSVQQMVFIQDYESSRRWLTRPARACYSELPEGKSVVASDTSTKGITAKPSILSAVPCNGNLSEKISTRVIKDTELSVWKCTDNQGNHYIQHFSSLLGVVIRQESQDGEIGELSDISLIDQPKSYFRPLDEWREVTLQEFITGRTLLPDYEN